jgi:hypothetical protein
MVYSRVRALQLLHLTSHYILRLFVVLYIRCSSLQVHLSSEVSSVKRAQNGHWNVYTQKQDNEGVKCFDDQFDAVVLAVDDTRVVARFMQESLHNTEHPAHVEVRFTFLAIALSFRGHHLLPFRSSDNLVVD